MFFALTTLNKSDIMVHPVVNDDDFDVSPYYLCNRSVLHDSIEKTITKLVIIMAMHPTTKLKQKLLVKIKLC